MNTTATPLDTPVTPAAPTTGARAELARWETEGGSPPPATSDGDALLLQRLGAALVRQWNELPMPLQRAVYDRAVAGLAPDEETAMKRRMARFLHQHKPPAGAA